MKTLLVAFSGKDNSSKILLDTIRCDDKLYLANDKVECCNQLTNILERNTYDRIILTGQKPVIKDKVCVELNAISNGNVIDTNFDLKDLFDKLTKNDVAFKISKRPGNSLCNLVYYHCLDLNKKSKSNTQTVFMHIPFYKNFTNFDRFVKFLNSFIIDSKQYKN